VAVKKTLDKKVKVIVSPITDNAYKEGYAFVNGKVVPFDIPVILEDKDVKALERRKEPKRIDSSGVNVHELMNRMKISQEKANRIARSGMADNMDGKVKVRYVNKYNIRYV